MEGIRVGGGHPRTRPDHLGGDNAYSSRRNRRYLSSTTPSPSRDPALASSMIRRTEPGGEALENQWSSAAVRHYRAAEPSRLVKDVPLYTL